MLGLVLGGGGEAGSRAVERNQKQMVSWWGPRAGKVPTMAGAMPPGVGHLGDGAWEGSRLWEDRASGYSL